MDAVYLDGQVLSFKWLVLPEIPVEGRKTTLIRTIHTGRVEKHTSIVHGEFYN